MRYTLVLLVCLTRLLRCTATSQPRFQHTMEIINGELCVFGGKRDNGTALSHYLLDFQCVDLTKPIQQASPEWHELSSMSRFAMPPFAQHTSVYYRKSHVVVPYGGQPPMGFSRLNRFTIFCTKFQAWGSSMPCSGTPRWVNHTAVLQEESGDIIIFGGVNNFLSESTMYDNWATPVRMILNGEAHQKHQESVLQANTSFPVAKTSDIWPDKGDKVPSDISPIMNHDSVMVNDTCMVVLGGNTYALANGTPVNMTHIPLDKAYLYDVDKRVWSVKTCSGKIPPSRSLFSASLYRDSIYIFGGVNLEYWESPFNDLYRLNTTTWRWTKISVANAPEPRYWHKMKTLGHYLVITHGYTVKSGGDPNIYFYDIRNRRFVDRYLPDGISPDDLNLQLGIPLTPTTKSLMTAILFLHAMVVIFAGYYLSDECWQLVNSRSLNSRNSTASRSRRRLQPRALSHSESMRESSLFAYRQSTDEQTLDGRTLESVPMSPLKASRSALSNNPIVIALGTAAVVTRDEVQSTYEGASTAVSSCDQYRGLGSRWNDSLLLGENMRHTRIIDDAPVNEPYVSRKLTVSSRLPSVGRPRPTPNRERIVRFMDSSDAFEIHPSQVGCTTSGQVSLANLHGLSTDRDADPFAGPNEHAAFYDSHQWTPPQTELRVTNYKP
ncbi:hypothetical protein GQ54DRAFT_305762 [Martensiomyces pterosporus]|nr:hypothetical protein GQ54DRAFT_305762 [Martensiomyces pterosporus]